MPKGRRARPEQPPYPHCEGSAAGVWLWGVPSTAQAGLEKSTLSSCAKKLAIEPSVKSRTYPPPSPNSSAINLKSSVRRFDATAHFRSAATNNQCLLLVLARRPRVSESTDLSHPIHRPSAHPSSTAYAEGTHVNFRRRWTTFPHPRSHLP